MSLVTISNLGKGFGAQTVLAGVNLRVARGEKVGIVGKNGGGKTTLLKMILGREQPDAGSVRVARGVRIGYLSQVAQVTEGRSVREEAETALSALADAESELRDAETALAESPEDEDLLERYGAARDRFDFLGGDAARDNLFGALSAMGFSDADLEKRVEVLSGGEKTRLSMAKLLASAPDVLALDEPTNHLDIRAVEWLEGFLQRFPGAVLVVSHDRQLLRAVCETIWEVEAQQINVYAGGFDKYQEVRAAQRARQLEEYERQQAEIARIEEYIRRNKAGQNAKNARGREKQLNRLERIERPVDEPDQMKARIASSGRSGQNVVVCEHARKAFGDKPILGDVTFGIQRGQRVGVVGPNGVGKSTFVEMVVGDEQPDSGYVRTGHGVSVAFHRQEADDFDPEQSVLDNFYERSGMTVAEARQHLAKFLFSGEDVFKPVSALSGGERAKLAMALMVLSPANLLILDEPTNHLDVYSCDALTDSLKKYNGTLLVVSHDRALLDAVTDTTLAFEGEGKVSLHEGAYSKYREAREAAKLSPPALNNGGAKKGQPAGANGTGKPSPPGSPIIGSAEGLTAHELSKERQRAAKRVSTLEGEIERLEAKLAGIEAKLGALGPSDDPVALSLEYGQVKDTLGTRMEEWEAATIEAEALGAAV